MEDNKDALTIRKDAYLTFDKDLGRYILTNKTVFHDAVIISIPSFLRLERELFKIFGSDAASLLQIAGEADGGESAKRLAHVEHAEDDLREVLNSVSKWGFGKYELSDLDFDRGYVKFKLHNNPLAIPVADSANQKIDSHYFLIGFYTGYFHNLFKELVFCSETKCMNRGEAFCEFEVRKMARES
jgi:predicted hydrocarbon binding protein